MNNNYKNALLLRGCKKTTNILQHKVFQGIIVCTNFSQHGIARFGLVIGPSRPSPKPAKTHQVIQGTTMLQHYSQELLGYIQVDIENNLPPFSSVWTYVDPKHRRNLVEEIDQESRKVDQEPRQADQEPRKGRSRTTKR